jgi:hypothetical protein
MKIRIKHIRQLILLTVVMVFTQPYVLSQGTDMTRLRQKSLFVGISLAPSQSQINNEGTQSVKKLVSGKMSSISGLFELGYLFSNYIGLTSGIGLISYKTQLTLSDYQNKYTTTDSETESYERRVSGTGIKEIQNVSTLSIPVCVILNLPVGERIGFYLQPGINIAIPLGNSYQSNGTFSYKGYYATDNVLLENLPDFDFPSNVSGNSEGKLELKSLMLYSTVSAGVEYFIQDNLQIAVGVLYNKSLSNISQYTSPDKFQLSSKANQITSLMAGSDKATASSMGLKIALRYYLK